MANMATSGAGTATASWHRRSKRVWPFLVVILLGPFSLATTASDSDIHDDVSNWAIRFGAHLWEAGKQFTRIREIRERYQTAGIERIDGLAMVKDFAEETENMMADKMEAIKRIMDAAEHLAADLEDDHDELERGNSVDYYNAKKLNSYEQQGDEAGSLEEGFKEVRMLKSRHFGESEVNISLSAVHVPTNVFDGAPDVMKGIYWSKRLNRIFIDNFDSDPSLSWQFFGSSTGFMRQFPATQWEQDEMKPDMFDCRLRPWYLQAAASPKDLFILIDTSGSMTGVRKEIAKHVVLTLLDTLSENDFVNIYSFSDHPVPIVPCFEGKMVQANLENLKELEAAMENLDTTDIANFTSSLSTAFEILAKYNRSGLGAQCNQAIMLVTDGAPSGYKEVFEKYNWPHKLVRLFSYLIGREITDTTATNWMSCENKGFFVRVTSLAEVREQVLKYVPVLSRPMVMYQKEHPINWTPVYADIADKSQQKYRLVTTVSTPVFDRKNYSVRTANLLGVAGTDVPISEIKKRTPAYKLGVNGYSFIVNNNGYLLHHPDFRPMVYDILKPNYNAVDLSEVELVDSDAGPRSNDSALLTMRREMLERREGEMLLNVRIHYDSMKRASVRRQRYYYRGLKGTPFSLGVVLPEGYGHFRIVAETEVKRAIADHNTNVTSFFSGKNWRVHPDWTYCRYNYDHIKSFPTPESEVLHFVDRTQRERWKWNSKHPRPSKEGGPRTHKQEDNYYCDKHLMQSLIFDAQATEIFEKNISLSIDHQEPQPRFQLFDISVAFIATRSGLLRWQDISSINEESSDEFGHFSDENVKAIDQIWYKRAVDQYEVDPDSFVFSVPFDAGCAECNKGNYNNSVVTASHAIFVEKDGYRAPVAVVGLQYKSSNLRENFFNITSSCTERICKRTCNSGDLDCYVLDNNGYVIISKNQQQTGKFFGEIDGTIMDSLVQAEVYQRIRIYDYQAVCMDPTSYKSSAAFLLTPWRYFKWAVQWAIGRASWLLLQTQLAHIIDPEWAQTMEYEQTQEETDEENEKPAPPFPGKQLEEEVQTEIYLEHGLLMDDAYINKTRTRPCDMYVDLYSLQPKKFLEGGKTRPWKGRWVNCSANTFFKPCERNYSIHKIPHSNLVLLVLDASCKCETRKLTVEPQEVIYNASKRCERMQDHLFRVRPSPCINYHPEEVEIKLCGGIASISHPSTLATFLLALLVFLNSLNARPLA